jgi:hypothetical protein
VVDSAQGHCPDVNADKVFYAQGPTLKLFVYLAEWCDVHEPAAWKVAASPRNGAPLSTVKCNTWVLRSMINFLK